MSETHISVLLREAADALLPERGGTLVDGTFGRGGHSRALLGRMPSNAQLIAIDRDAAAAESARSIADSRFTFVAAHFGNMSSALANIGVTQVDGILLDIGVSSPQLDDATRGFSFMRDGPLDMRMDQSCGPTAADWIATASHNEITEVIRDYGEERFASRIAAEIVAQRERQPVERTLQLAQIVEKAVSTRWTGQHPATKTFQAIRIHINRELEELRMALSAALPLLAPGGRLAVISFHSLEDRMVKLWMREQAGRAPEDPRLRHLPQVSVAHPKIRLVGRDVAPSDAEVRANPRSRSARLRVSEKLGTNESASA
ncbi:MAG: 16S rRNA (cytosine(1402)-N(4))-methyltransferase RsmH [Casimicrobium sp.]